MRAVVLICSLVLVALIGPAMAGDYGGTGWYRGECCARIAAPARTVRSMPGAYYPYGIHYGRQVAIYPEVEPHRVVRFSEHDFYTSVADYAQARCHWQQVPLRAGATFWVWGVKTDCW
jgi:hypothetical protein